MSYKTQFVHVDACAVDQVSNVHMNYLIILNTEKKNTSKQSMERTLRNFTLYFNRN